MVKLDIYALSIVGQKEKLTIIYRRQA